MKRIRGAGRDVLLGVTKVLKNSSVKVGYPKGSGKHEGSGLSYAELMFLQEVQGVPSRNGLVRRRPFEVTMRTEGPVIIDNLLKRIANAYIYNNRSTQYTLGWFGNTLSETIKAKFGNKGVLQPNAPMTIRKKGFDSPLIETGDLFNNLHFKVVTK